MATKDETYTKDLESTDLAGLEDEAAITLKQIATRYAIKVCTNIGTWHQSPTQKIIVFSKKLTGS